MSPIPSTHIHISSDGTSDHGSFVAAQTPSWVARVEMPEPRSQPWKQFKLEDDCKFDQGEDFSALYPPGMEDNVDELAIGA